MSEEVSVVRFYTLARKIPFLLGKLGDWVLPGGPYTLTQGIAFVGVAVIGQRTMPLWATGMAPIIAWVPVLIVAAVAALGAGRIPLKGRNPLLMFLGLVGYVDAPEWGRQGRRHVALKKTRSVRQRYSVPSSLTAIQRSVRTPVEAVDEDLVEREDDAALDQVAIVSPAAPTAPAPSPHQLTEVQRILAASAQRR